MKRILFGVFLPALLLPAADLALAHGSHTLHLGTVGGRLAVKLPADFEIPKLMFKAGSTYIRDFGADIYWSMPNGYDLSSVVMRQVDISPGITASDIFGVGAPGDLLLDLMEPHVHVPFTAAAPGTYQMTFRLTDGLDNQGNPVPDSEVFRYIWVAGGNYARVSLDVLRSLPDTPFNPFPREFAGVELTDMVVSASVSAGFFIQDPARTGGIFVAGTNSVAPGDHVKVQGLLSTVAGERIIVNPMVTVLRSESAPAPLVVRPSEAGGSSPGKYTPGATGAIGLSNIGLLVKVAGYLERSGPEIYLSDGRGRVLLDTSLTGTPASLPADGSLLVATGISALAPEGTGFKPALRLVDASQVEIP